MIKNLPLAILICAFIAVTTTPHARGTTKPNVLLLCIDDLRPELGCYGVDYIQSPNIDALAERSRIFTRHYVQAPTCGASRYTLLTGRYGNPGNSALFDRAARLKKNPGAVPPSMPAWFRQHGYTTVSVGKVSHHPGGRGGADWDDDSKLEMPDSWDRHLLPAGDWQDPRGHMHGLAHGEIRKNAKDMDVFQAVEGPDSIYPDGLTTDEALAQLDLLASDDKPFFLAVGIIRPHLPFGAPAKYLEPYKEAILPETPHPGKPDGKTTYHGSGEFMKYNRWGRDPNKDAEFALECRRYYAACVTYADTLVGRVLAKLESSAAANNTIIVLWGDHGWHLGEHAVWGKHTLFEESLLSPLLIHTPGLPKPGRKTDAIVESLDLFPTLCSLAGLPMPDFTHGVSLQPILDNPSSKGHTAVSYHRSHQSIRTGTHRLILHKDGFTELYDHTTAKKETKNIAETNPSLVEKLRIALDAKLTQ
ncbi:MAG: sulfatase [Verrucomicrobiota bacterium]